MLWMTDRAKSVRFHLAVGGDIHEDGVGQTVHRRFQTAQIVGQPFRQHRDHLVHEIDARPARIRFVVQDRVFAHVVAHIGDVHSETEHPVAEIFARQRIVEVLRIDRIDGEADRVAQVQPPCDLLRGDGPGESGGGTFNLRRETPAADRNSAPR